MTGQHTLIISTQLGWVGVALVATFLEAGFEEADFLDAADIAVVLMLVMVG